MNRLIIITLIASYLAWCLPELQYFPCNSTLPTTHSVLNRLQKWILTAVNLLEIVILHPVFRFICILVANYISDSNLILRELTVVFGHYSNTQAVAKKTHTAAKMCFLKNCVKALGA